MAKPKGKANRAKRPPEKQFLTTKQSDIVACIKVGLRNTDIATAVGIDVRTVSAHIRSIYKKFEIDPRKNVYYLITKLDEMGKIE